jgi:nitroreductase
MDLSEAMRTTPSCRDFTDEPVGDETIADILDDARFAGSGGNRQGQHVVVVRNPAIRAAIRDLIQPIWNTYRAMTRAGENPFNPVTPTAVDLDEAAATPSPIPDLPRYTFIGGGSVYPFCQNVLLAARDRGLGATMTTFLAGNEPAARDLLGFPDHYAVAATIAIGHPVRQLTRLARKPVSAFTTVDRFDGPAFPAA